MSDKRKEAMGWIRHRQTEETLASTRDENSEGQETRRTSTSIGVEPERDVEQKGGMDESESGEKGEADKRQALRERAKALKGVQTVMDKAQDAAFAAGSKLSSAVLPGGLALPFGVLVLLWVFVLPINGQPRIAWLWDVLTEHIGIVPEGGDSSFLVESEANSIDASAIAAVPVLPPTASF
jgi:hypothetical protein